MTVTGAANRPTILLTGLAAGLAIGLSVVAASVVGGLLGAAVVGVLAAGTSVALVFGAERVLFGVILLNLPFQLDTYLAYRADEAALGALGGVPVSLTTLSLLLLMACRAVAPRSPRLLPPSASTWRAFAVFLGLSLVSMGSAGDRVLAFYTLVMLLQAFILYVYLTAALRTPSDIRWAVTMLLAGLLAQGGLLVAQRATGLALGGSEPDPTLAGGDVVNRVSGTLGSPNSAAAYLSVVLLIALAVMLSKPTGLRAILAGTATMVGGAGLALTASRGGLLAFAIGAVTLVTLAARRRFLRTGTVLAVAAGIGVLAMLFGGGILLRIAGDDAGAAQSRVPLMVIAVRMIGAAPLHGVGLNNFATALPEFVTPEYSRDWLYVVHNYYLQIAAETGVFGLLAFVAFLASVVRSAWAASRTLPNDLSVLALSVLAAVVARAVHMNVDLFGAPAGWEALVVVAALAAALLRQSRPPAGDRGSKRVLVPVDTTPP